MHATGLGVKSHLVGGGKVDTLDYAGMCDSILSDNPMMSK